MASGPHPIDRGAPSDDASRMITTPVRDSQHAAVPASPSESLGRFLRVRCVAERKAVPSRTAGRSLGDVVRAGEYVVDADAVAEAVLARLLAGRPVDPPRRD
jgi:hypothetical protein